MLEKYTIFQIIQLIYFKIRTYFVISNARIIRFPFDLRGYKYMSINKNLTTGYGCRIEADSSNNSKVLYMGENIQMNDYVHITATQKVIIGNNVLMASKIYISDTIHGSYLGDENDSNPNEVPINRKLSKKEVIIQDNVWIGEFVSILPGVTIGKGVIIGANSVVSRSLPEYTICVGSPAVPIKKYNFDSNKWEKIIK